MADRKTTLAPLLLLIFLLFSSGNVFAQSLKNVTYENPVYLFLDRAYAKKWIAYLPAAKPYTEKKVYSLLEEIMSQYKSYPEGFATRDIEELNHYIQRLEGDKFSLFKKTGNGFSAEVNIAPYTSFNMALDSPSDTATSFGADLAIGGRASSQTSRFQALQNPTNISPLISLSVKRYISYG